MKALKLPPHIFLNVKIKLEKDKIRRFVPVYYPVYSLPVEFTERSSEPYEELEKNISKLLEKTELKTREQLFQMLGIDTKEIGDNIVDYLISINHIYETKNVLYLTELGSASLREDYKIKEEKSERLMYFDALSLKPLPKEYYKSKQIEFLSSGEVQSLKHANIIDSWQEFRQGNLQKILQYKKEERRDYNVPGEAVSLKLSDEICKDALSTSTTCGVINYLPLYLLVAEDLKTFNRKLKGKDYSSLNIHVYNGASGEKCDFFTTCILESSRQLEYILRPLLEYFNPLVDENLMVWGEQLSEKKQANLKNIAVNSLDNNLEISINKEDVLMFINNNNARAIKDIAYNNLIPLKEKNFLGLLIRIKSNNKARKIAIQTIIKEQQNIMNRKGYSQEKINNELEKLKLRIQKDT